MDTLVRCRGLAVSVSCCMLIAVGAVPAAAHDGWISEQSRGKAGTHTTHFWIDSCDQSSDGLKVRAWSAVYGTVTAYALSWDPDGAGGDCAHDKPSERVGSGQHRVCIEHPIGCSPYVFHGP
jgi:hypothetical protein